MNRTLAKFFTAAIVFVALLVGEIAIADSNKAYLKPPFIITGLMNFEHSRVPLEVDTPVFAERIWDEANEESNTIARIKSARDLSRSLHKNWFTVFGEGPPYTVWRAQAQSGSGLVYLVMLPGSYMAARMYVFMYDKGKSLRLVEIHSTTNPMYGPYDVSVIAKMKIPKKDDDKYREAIIDILKARGVDNPNAFSTH